MKLFDVFDCPLCGDTEEVTNVLFDYGEFIKQGGITICCHCSSFLWALTHPRRRFLMRMILTNLFYKYQKFLQGLQRIEGETD